MSNGLREPRSRGQRARRGAARCTRPAMSSEIWSNSGNALSDEDTEEAILRDEGKTAARFGIFKFDVGVWSLEFECPPELFRRSWH